MAAESLSGSSNAVSMPQRQQKLHDGIKSTAVASRSGRQQWHASAKGKGGNLRIASAFKSITIKCNEMQQSTNGTINQMMDNKPNDGVAWRHGAPWSMANHHGWHGFRCYEVEFNAAKTVWMVDMELHH
jgi:hypothetical protein